MTSLRTSTPQIVTRLNPETSLDELMADIEEIGYPYKQADRGLPEDRPRK